MDLRFQLDVTSPTQFPPSVVMKLDVEGRWPSSVIAAFWVKLRKIVCLSGDVNVCSIVHKS